MWSMHAFFCPEDIAHGVAWRIVSMAAASMALTAVPAVGDVTSTDLIDGSRVSAALIGRESC